MSKSLGNYFTLRDLLAKGFSGREIRHLLMSSHYREQFNFTLEGLNGARTALTRIDECLAKLREIAADTVASPDAALLARFSESLDHDLNVSGAWGVIFEWIRETNRLLAANQFSPEDAAQALAAWEKMNSVLGFASAGETEIPAGLTVLLEERQAARQAKDFKRSDAIRDELKARGWVIEDTPKGPRLKKI